MTENEKNVVCTKCQRRVIPDSHGGWIDPNATGDDAVWREYCEQATSTSRYHRVHTGASEMVTTWADGFGRWHARVDLPGIGYGDYLNSQIDRIRAKARRAIRREIRLRGSDWGNANMGPVRVEVVDSRQHPNTLTTMSITYAEKN